MSIVAFIDLHASTTIDSPRNRQMCTSMQNDSSLDLSQITPTLFPTGKRPFGVAFKVNAHGEHVIAAVWPGHAAARAKIAAGSVLVRIDGQPLPRSLRRENSTRDNGRKGRIGKRFHNLIRDFLLHPLHPQRTCVIAPGDDGRNEAA